MRRSAHSGHDPVMESHRKWLPPSSTAASATAVDGVVNSGYSAYGSAPENRFDSTEYVVPEANASRCAGPCTGTSLPLFDFT